MNKIRKNYRGEDPTAVAALKLYPPRQLPPAKSPTPVGGVTITPAARQQARSFGLHPYQVSAMQRKAAAKRLRDGHQFQFMSHQVFIDASGDTTTITHVM